MDIYRNGINDYLKQAIEAVQEYYSECLEGDGKSPNLKKLSHVELVREKALEPYQSHVIRVWADLPNMKIYWNPNSGMVDDAFVCFETDKPDEMINILSRSNWDDYYYCLHKTSLEKYYDNRFQKGDKILYSGKEWTVDRVVKAYKSVTEDPYSPQGRGLANERAYMYLKRFDGDKLIWSGAVRTDAYAKLIERCSNEKEVNKTVKETELEA